MSSQKIVISVRDTLPDYISENMHFIGSGFCNDDKPRPVSYIMRENDLLFVKLCGADIVQNITLNEYNRMLDVLSNHLSPSTPTPFDNDAGYKTNMEVGALIECLEMIDKYSAYQPMVKTSPIMRLINRIRKRFNK